MTQFKVKVQAAVPLNGKGHVHAADAALEALKGEITLWEAHGYTVTGAATGSAAVVGGFNRWQATIVMTKEF